MKLAALPPEKIYPKKLQDVLVCFSLCQEKHIVGAPAATRAPFPLRTSRNGCFAAGHRHHCQHPLPLVVQRSPVARRHHALHLRMGPKQSQIAVVTGACSGVGLYAARALINKGNWHIVMACSDVDRAERTANNVNLPKDAYTVLHCDLADFASVLKFVRELSSVARVDHLDALTCNAAIWHPPDKKGRFTVDGIKETMHVWHLSHLLLCRELLPKLKRSRGRIVFLTTQTRSPNSLPGKIPPQARLGDLSGLAAGLGPQTTGKEENSPFEPTKAYKDTKAANVLTMKALSDRYGRDGVTYVAIFPGCVADGNLFLEKRGWFRYVFFPILQKYITRQYVPNDEAGRRVAEVATQGQFSDSGSYYQWRGKYTEGRDKTKPQVIEPTYEIDKADQLYELSLGLIDQALRRRGLKSTILAPV